jgi:hypothetical protein
MVLTLLERLALRRRRPGANPIWTVVALTAFLLRQHQRRSARDRDVVALREELRPGESIVITHTHQPRG